MSNFAWRTSIFYVYFTTKTALKLMYSSMSKNWYSSFHFYFQLNLDLYQSTTTAKKQRFMSLKKFKL